MLMRLLRSRTRAAERGQGLAEFALVAPILLVIMLAIVQFAWIFTSQIGLTNSIRDAARFAATNPTVNPAQVAINGPAAVAQLNLILPRNVNFYAASNLSAATATYCEYTDPSGRFAVRVRVTVQYRHPLFIPLITPILDGFDGNPTDNALLVGATEEMRVENSPPFTGTTRIPSC